MTPDESNKPDQNDASLRKRFEAIEEQDFGGINNIQWSEIVARVPSNQRGIVVLALVLGLSFAAFALLQAPREAFYITAAVIVVGMLLISWAQYNGKNRKTNQAEPGRTRKSTEQDR